MTASEYDTAFPLKYALKDMRFALAEAEAVAQPLPVASAANEAYKRAMWNRRLRCGVTQYHFFQV